MRAHEERLVHMLDAPDRRNEYFRLDVVLTKSLEDLFSHLHSIFPFVIQAPDKWTDHCRTCFCSEYRLFDAKDERCVRPNLLSCEIFQRLQSFCRHRHFYDDVFMPACILFPLFDHARCIRRRNLRTHIRNMFAHLENSLLKILALLCDKAGIGCDAIENAPRSYFCDLVGIGSIEEELHRLQYNSTRSHSTYNQSPIAPVEGRSRIKKM